MLKTLRFLNEHVYLIFHASLTIYSSQQRKIKVISNTWRKSQLKRKDTRCTLRAVIFSSVRKSRIISGTSFVLTLKNRIIRTLCLYNERFPSCWTIAQEYRWWSWVNHVCGWQCEGQCLESIFHNLNVDENCNWKNTNYPFWTL